MVLKLVFTAQILFEKFNGNYLFHKSNKQFFDRIF